MDRSGERGGGGPTVVGENMRWEGKGHGCSSQSRSGREGREGGERKGGHQWGGRFQKAVPAVCKQAAVLSCDVQASGMQVCVQRHASGNLVFVLWCALKLVWEAWEAGVGSPGKQEPAACSVVCKWKLVIVLCCSSGVLAFVMRCGGKGVRWH